MACMLRHYINISTEQKQLHFCIEFCRAMLSAAYAVARCPSVRSSVCLSVTFMYSVETNKHRPIFHFFTIGSHHSIVFSMPNLMAIFRREPPNAASNAGELGKKSRFSTTLAPSRAVNSLTAKYIAHSCARPWQVDDTVAGKRDKRRRW